MSTPRLPPELIDQIVDSTWEVTSSGITLATSRKALINLSYVSRSFYTSARRRLWTRIRIDYQPPPARWSAKHNALYEILSQNPSLCADIRNVCVSVAATTTHPALVRPKRGTAAAMNERSATPNALAKALCLLANTGKIRSLGIFFPYFAMTDRCGLLRACEENVLFALTALRISPSLRKFDLHNADSPPPALLFGHPRFDAVERIGLFEVDFPSPTTPTFRDYTISRDAALSLHLSEDNYRAVVQAIGYFTPTPHAQFPLLPKAKHILQSIGRQKTPLIPYILQQQPIDASKPLGGHLLSLDSSEYEPYRFPTDMVAVRLKQDLRNIARQLKHLKPIREKACHALDSSTRLEELRSLKLEVMSSAFESLYDPASRPGGSPLGAVLRVLDLISPSNFPSLEAIFVELFIEAVQGDIPYLLLGSQSEDGSVPSCWSPLDTSFVALAARLAPQCARLNVQLKLSITFPDAGWETVPMHEKAFRDAGICQDTLLELFPKSKADGVVNLEVVLEADDAC